MVFCGFCCCVTIFHVLLWSALDRVCTAYINTHVEACEMRLLLYCCLYHAHLVSYILTRRCIMSYSVLSHVFRLQIHFSICYFRNAYVLFRLFFCVPREGLNLIKSDYFPFFFFTGTKAETYFTFAKHVTLSNRNEHFRSCPSFALKSNTMRHLYRTMKRSVVMQAPHCH